MSALSEAVQKLEKAQDFHRGVSKIDESINYKVSINQGSGIDHIFEGKYLRSYLLNAADQEIRDTKKEIDDIIHPTQHSHDQGS